MSRDLTYLYCSSQDFKEKISDWSDRWYAIRQRQPFFFLQGYNQEINNTTVELFKKFLSIIPLTDPVDVIIHSPGGEMSSSFKATLIFQALDYISVVPKYAKSGATLFSLGGKEIIMGKWAELGPLDPQVTSFNTERKYWREQESSLESFHAARYAQREVIEQFNAFIDFLIGIGLSGKSSVQDAIKLTEATIGKVYSNVSSFELGRSGRLLDVMEKYCLRVLQRSHSNINECKKIAKHLVWEYPTHDFYIDLEEAKSIGLKARAASANEQQLLTEFDDDYGKVTCFGTAIAIISNNSSETNSDANENKGDSNVKE